MALACYAVAVVQRTGHETGSEVCCAWDWRAGAEAERVLALTHCQAGMKGTKHDLWRGNCLHGFSLEPIDHLPGNYLASGADAWPVHEAACAYGLSGSPDAGQDLGA